MLQIAHVWLLQLFLYLKFQFSVFKKNKGFQIGTVATFEYLRVIYVILSNFYNFSQLVNTHPLLFYQLLSSHQTFLILSNFCHFLTLSYLLTFYFIYTSYKCTCCTHHKHNALTCLIVRTLSAPIYLSNSPGVFGHRAILTMGGIGPGLGVSS